MMTKAQAIRRLVKLGWTVEPASHSRFLVWATSPQGERGLFDPRDLLIELGA